MTDDEVTITLELPSKLVEKLDAIAEQKYRDRADIIVDACAYYCQFHEMNSELFPQTMRNVFFNLARHDDEFRKTLKDVLLDDAIANNSIRNG